MRDHQRQGHAAATAAVTDVVHVLRTVHRHVHQAGLFAFSENRERLLFGYLTSRSSLYSVISCLVDL